MPHIVYWKMRQKWQGWWVLNVFQKLSVLLAAEYQFIKLKEPRILFPNLLGGEKSPQTKVYYFPLWWTVQYPIKPLQWCFSVHTYWAKCKDVSNLLSIHGNRPSINKGWTLSVLIKGTNAANKTSWITFLYSHSITHIPLLYFTTGSN